MLENLPEEIKDEVAFLLGSRLEAPGYAGRKFAHVLEDIYRLLVESGHWRRHHARA